MTPDSAATARRLAAELAAERYRNRVATQRLMQLGPAYERARIAIGALQNNRFWRLRQGWFGLKQRLGLDRGGPAPDFDLPPIAADAPLDRYELWRSEYDYREADDVWMAAAAAALRLRPRFSVIVPTFNTPEPYLRAMLDSVLAQIYPDWELCVADDASTEPHVAAVLSAYAAADPRIKLVFRAVNGHISVASNAALALATGDFAVLLDHDDLLAPHALFANALQINAFPQVDMLYSDEDKIDDDGRRTNPFFKPDWSPDTFLSRMYTGHLGVYRTELVRRIGGFRESFEGSQDYDLVLRLTERTTAIEHIPHVLYHWRIHRGSTTSGAAAKPYAALAAIRALREALERRGETADVIADAGVPGTYAIRYPLNRVDRVSAVIVVRDVRPQNLCAVRALFDATDYPDVEAIVVDCTARGTAADVLAKSLRGVGERLRIVRAACGSRMGEASDCGASLATGTYLLFMSGALEAEDPRWLTALVEQAQRPAVGAAGPKIVSRDGRLQHAGLVVGIGGIAGFPHRGVPGDVGGYFNAIGAVRNVSAVTPACLLTRRALYAEIGGFDHRLSDLNAAVDWCLRLRSAGSRIVYVPRARLIIGDERELPGAAAAAAPGEAFESALLEERWAISRMHDPCYNRNLTRTREDYSPAP